MATGSIASAVCSVAPRQVLNIQVPIVFAVPQGSVSGPVGAGPLRAVWQTRHQQRQPHPCVVNGLLVTDRGMRTKAWWSCYLATA